MKIDIINISSGFATFIEISYMVFRFFMGILIIYIMFLLIKLLKRSILLIDKHLKGKDEK